MKTVSSIVAAISSLLAAGVVANIAVAGETAMEKCYGVAKAGKNDCAGAAHACAGQAKADAGGKEFLTLPKGTCERLVGGSLTPKN